MSEVELVDNYVRPKPEPTGLQPGFYHLEKWTGTKCVVGNCKGSDIRVSFVQVDADDRFHQLTALQTNKRSKPAVCTIGYSYCNNPRCVRHVRLGTRKLDDSESLVKQLKANHWKRQQKNKRRSNHNRKRRR